MADISKITLNGTNYNVKDANAVSSGDVQNQITAATSAFTTSGDVQSAITSATSGLQETLVSGTNIKTINNQSILGSGNITIQGGSGGGETVIELTQAQYDALTAYSPDTTYIITDATPVSLEDYATTATTSAISADVATLSSTTANKADKASVTQRAATAYYAPGWNAQGIITGETRYYRTALNINGSSVGNIDKSSNTTIPNIYTPTSAGTQNTILMSNGSGAPSWSSIKMEFISQSAYNAITTKDANTLYFIISEN